VDGGHEDLDVSQAQPFGQGRPEPVRTARPSPISRTTWLNLPDRSARACPGRSARSLGRLCPTWMALAIASMASGNCCFGPPHATAARSPRQAFGQPQPGDGPDRHGGDQRDAFKREASARTRPSHEPDGAGRQLDDEESDGCHREPAWASWRGCTPSRARRTIAGQGVALSGRTADYGDPARAPRGEPRNVTRRAFRRVRSARTASPIVASKDGEGRPTATGQLLGLADHRARLVSPGRLGSGSPGRASGGGGHRCQLQLVPETSVGSRPAQPPDDPAGF
jgi:hypothetical protein